jgi:4-amino-4-deoxy-L-arabinose transferase-like glycosyltransferase
MLGRRWRILAELVLVLALAVVATLTIARAPAKQAGDEANWLGTARYFLVLFVRHDISAESWPDSYWMRTQPMIPRYVMGGWLWARGYDYEGLDPSYDHRRKWFSNVEEGKAPTNEVLTEARIPMRALTVVAAVLLYGVVRVLSGPLGGAVAALLFSGSPYLALHMVRAMGEPPFIAFLLATLLVMLIAVKRGSRRGPGWRWGALAGVLLGLAFASKLTAIIAIVAIMLWGVWALVGGTLVRLLPLPLGVTTTRGPRTLLWSLLVVGVGLLTFVATNPFLYHDPVGRTLLLFQNRQTEMTAQAEIDPSRAVTTLAESARLVWRNSLVEDTWTESRLHRPIEAMLAVIGLGWLALRALRHRAEALVLICVLGFFGGVTVGLGYVLDHYFVPTATMGLILTGLTVGWSTQLAWSTARRLTRRQRQAMVQQEPATA